MVESLIENLHREDLSDVEKAKALKIIMEKEGIRTQEGLSKKVGMPPRTIGYIFDSAGIRGELAGPAKGISKKEDLPTPSQLKVKSNRTHE